MSVLLTYALASIDLLYDLPLLVTSCGNCVLIRVAVKFFYDGFTKLFRFLPFLHLQVFNPSALLSKKIKI